MATMSGHTEPKSWKLNHTMLRVKDPKKSIAFYEHLGLTNIQHVELPQENTTKYFMAADHSASSTKGKHRTARQGMVELSHTHGSEHDDNFKVASGNEKTKEEGRGFGHVCVSVDNIQAACDRIEKAKLGRGWQKKLEDGKMHSIAFALDPDGYWVEIIGQNPVEKTKDVTHTDPNTYVLNHSMLRIKDSKRSLAFYQDVFGMNLIRENKNDSFNLYFLGYHPANEGTKAFAGTSKFEGLLELTWNHGTEKEDEDPMYHNGNTNPKGMGNIGISVDDLQAACQRLDAKGVKWEKRLADGPAADVACLYDPDGYSIRLIQNEELKKPI